MRHFMQFVAIAQVAALACVLWGAEGGEVPAVIDTASETARGVVVEEVGYGSALAKAGLEPGDVLLAWRRLPAPPANPNAARGELTSAFDWMWLKLEQAPRGTVELTGQRGGEARMFAVAPGLWEAKVRPWMPGALLENYLRGRQHLDAAKTADAALWWEKVAATARDWRLRCWMWLRLGEVWAQQRESETVHATYRLGLEEVQDAFPKSVLWQAMGQWYVKQSEFDLATQAYGSAREIREKASGERSLALAEILNDLGSTAWQRRDLDGAADFFRRALEILQELAPESLGMARILNNLGAVAWARGDLANATDSFQRALEIRKKQAPDSLDVAQSLNSLGSMARKRGDLAQAEDLYQRALDIRQNQVPDSIAVAVTLHNLGVVASRVGDLVQATDLYQRALEIKQKQAPDSLTVALSLSNLGVVARKRGDLLRATDLYQAALEIQNRQAPDSLDVATTLNNLGVVAWRRGDLTRAMAFYHRALEIRQKLAPDSLDVAQSLNNLASGTGDRGDLDRATKFFQRTLEIQRKLAPDSLPVATTLSNLGVVARRRGDLSLATDFYQRALEIQQKLAPDSLPVATTLNNLGVVIGNRGELARATEFFKRALEIQQKLAPDSLSMANTLHGLGFVAGQREDLDQALNFLRRALKIRQELAPESVKIAETLHHLGLLHRQKDPLQLAIADDSLSLALDILEKHLARLGGSYDVRGGFGARFHEFYGDALEVQLRLGHPYRAFYTFERSRARTFLERLVERDTVFTADIPEKLDQERRSVAVRFDRTQQQLGQLNPRDHAGQIEELLDQLRQLRDEARDIEEKIRRASPRLAALQYPAPLGLDAARGALDARTLMLSYSVGKESTVLFTLSKDHDLGVERLAIPEEQLADQVQALRRQIQNARRSGSQRIRDLQNSAVDLFATLIEPVADRVAESERLLILADGPLHYLPWGALRRNTTDGGQYLVEWKPFHLALSATVYAELRKLRSEDNVSPPAVQLAAFGDPHYPGTRESAGSHRDPVVRSVAEQVLFGWEQLPYTRREVAGIAGAYPEEYVRVYLGEEATEEHAKSIGRDVRILHFATHGHLDERFPLNSFIALTIPEEYSEDRENGLLQAWEIFERVRIEADLVVLSACETALGEEQGGEGLIGLTRAFQYAGARTVAASLWRVDDRSTAELMTRFYRHLREGKAKDEALRSAQLELLQGPIQVQSETGEYQEFDASAPYYWAAFQVYGDWQ
ncbi:MAG: tetratricopeptide repeat protein [bacterium]|nr:tetratricopeptide repeat protein [bacterium]